MKFFFLIASLTFLFALNVISQNKNKSEIIIEKAVEKLATGFKFTEGPAVDKEGNVYFTDIPNGQLFIWNTTNKLDTFKADIKGVFGLYFDKNGQLLATEGGKGRVISINKMGEIKVLADQFQGKAFNQPNDLWPDPKGGIYFTDPKYGGQNPQLTQDGMHVYYISPKSKDVIRVCNDLVKPNGILGTPDGKTLYVADHVGGKLYKYDIKKDGSLENKTVFVEKGCDGMTMDKNGNLYVTPTTQSVIEIYSPKGMLLKSIEVPQQPSNVCFGGKDRNELFITARTSIYRVVLNTTGID